MPISGQSGNDGYISLSPEMIDALRQQQRVSEQTQRQGLSGAREYNLRQQINMQTPVWTVDGISLYETNTLIEQPLEQPQRTGIAELLRGRQRVDGLTDLQRKRKREKEEIELFIRTGASDQAKYVGEDGTLMVTGYDMGDTPILFLMDNQSIVAQEKRTKHLKPLLVSLAKREGLELRLTDIAPEYLPNAKRISYFVFNNQEEIDDSALVTVTQPIFRDTQHNHNDGVCGDLECNECYDDDEDDEEDEDDEMPF